MNGAAGTLAGMTREAQSAMQERARDSALDLVSREEPAAVKAMATAAREENEAPASHEARGHDWRRCGEAASGQKKAGAKAPRSEYPQLILSELAFLRFTSTKANSWEQKRTGVTTMNMDEYSQA